MSSYRQSLSTFDIKATPASLLAGLKPDELMLDWTALPTGATASIYSPVLSADEIISMAGSMYGAQPFTRMDANTLGCACRGIAFMPIPPGTGNYAGLLTVELPNTIRKGDKFTVTATQITNAQAASRREGHSRLTWRTILGSFQLAIKIESQSESLPIMEQKLSLLRWILNSIPATDRWYPIFLRYIGAVANQVLTLGGDPSAIPPSATGTWPGGPGEGTGKGRHKCKSDSACHFVGKISGLIYDHFGDFEGFILEADSGDAFTFYSRERHMQELAHRAWAERLRITVMSEHREKERPRRIVLHPATHPF